MKRTTSRASGAAVAVLALLFMLISSTGLAQVPQTISYQGSLTDSGGAPVSGPVAMTFNLYDAAVGGTLLWQETQPAVSVTNGAFGTVFGADAGNPLDVSLFAGQLYLGIAVGGDAEMTPRQALTAVGYAIQAKNAETLGGLQSSEIIDAAADEVRTPITALPFFTPAPGSYYLTGDLTSAGNGIILQSDDVTIDLMGFSLIGSGAGLFNGVDLGIYSNVEIRNGTISNFGQHGIRSSPGATTNRVIGVRFVGNLGHGVRLPDGSGDQLSDCVVSHNEGGVFLGESAVIARNVVFNNGGISGGGGSTVIENTVRASGSNGIQAGAGSTISDNLVEGSEFIGIVAATGSSVTGNTVSASGERGISASDGTTVSNNTVHNNGTQGIFVSVGTTVTGNTVYNNQADGIFLSGNDFVDGNTAFNNNLSAGGFANISACASCTFGTNHAP